MASATTTDRQRWHEAFSAEEIQALRRVSNLHGAWMVASNWLLMGGAMALVAWRPNVLTILFALVLIGGRQLGLAIVMHEAAHRTLFSNRRLNDWAGNWLAGYFIYVGVDLYRPYHLQHHAHTALERDPDLNLKVGFPASRASVARKVARDLFGIVGLKRLIGTTVVLAATALGKPLGKGTAIGFMSDDAARGAARRTLVGFFVTHALLLGALWALGYPALFLLWLGAWLTTHNLVTRIRSIAEHAMTPATDDPFQNTRTVQAGPVERLFVAPNRVNYHLEHHLLMTVPHHRLPKLHAMLRERGLLEGACVEPSYARVLRAAAAG